MLKAESPCLHQLTQTRWMDFKSNKSLSCASFEQNSHFAAKWHIVQVVIMENKKKYLWHKFLTCYSVLISPLQQLRDTFIKRHGGSLRFKRSSTRIRFAPHICHNVNFLVFYAISNQDNAKKQGCNVLIVRWNCQFLAIHEMCYLRQKCFLAFINI